MCTVIFILAEVVRPAKLPLVHASVHSRHARLSPLRLLRLRSLCARVIFTDNYLSLCARSVSREKERNTCRERSPVLRVRSYVWSLFDVTFKRPCSCALLVALRRTGSLLILRTSLVTTDGLKPPRTYLRRGGTRRSLTREIRFFESIRRRILAIVKASRR